jgi:hypothetical protein
MLRHISAFVKSICAGSVFSNGLRHILLVQATPAATTLTAVSFCGAD